MTQAMPVQRTLVLALGQRGGQVARRLIEQIGRRHGGVPVVAVLHIAGQPAEDADLAIPLPAQADRAIARQALESERPAVRSLLSTTIRRVSHLGHRRTLTRIGLRLDRPDEVAVFLVGDLGEVVTSAWLLRLAEWAAALVSGQFKAVPVTTGVLLLPPMGPDAQENAAHARVVLEELDAALRPPASPAAMENRPAFLARWLPPFNRGCYLMSPFNEEGLTLADSEALADVIALGLYLHIFTPVRDALDWLPTPLDLDRRPAYASFGVAVRTWSGDAAARILAHAWAGDVLAAVLEESAPAATSPPAAAGASPSIVDLAPPRLIAEHLLPADLSPALLIPPGQPALALPWRLHAQRVEMDAAFAARARHLDRAHARIERRARKVARQTAQALRQRLAAALDANPVAGLAHAQHLADAWTHELRAYAGGLEARLEEDREGLSHIEAQAAAAAETLDDLVAPFPRSTLQEWLPLLRRPARILHLAARYRRVQAATGRYHLLREGQLERRLTILLEEQATWLYEVVHQHLAEARRTLAALRRALAAARDTLGDAPLPPDDETSLLDDALLSILHHATVGPAVEEARQALERCGPLSQWWEDRATPQAIVERLLEAGRVRLATVARMTAEQAWRQRYPDPDVRAVWLEAFLAEAQPLWRFDPTRLNDAERELLGRTAGLGVADPAASPLAGLTDGEGRPLRLIRLADDSCLVAFQVARGAPLEALAWTDGDTLKEVTDGQKPLE